nr:thiamine biosynthesis protein S [Schizostauron trachyderma]
MSKSKYFFLNGEKFFTDSELTLLELVKYLNYNTSLLVLEYNNLICNQKNWDKLYIKNNDKIEIVTIVGGG